MSGTKLESLTADRSCVNYFGMLPLSAMMCIQFTSLYFSNYLY